MAKPFLNLLMIIVLFTPAYAAAPPDWRNSTAHPTATPGEKLALGSFFPPAMETLDVQGNYAYVGAGASVLVIDVSNPDYPRQVAYRLLSGIARQVVAASNRVYVLTGTSQVLIFDIAGPGLLFLAGQFSSPNGVAYMDAEGERLYLDEGIGFVGLSILDSSDPKAVKLLGTLPLPAGFDPEIFKVFGNRVFMANNDYNNMQVFVVDVSDPYHPAVIGQPFTLPGFTPFYDLAVSGNIAALAGIIPGGSFDSAEIRIIDISNPKQLVEMNGIYLSAGFDPRVAIEGHRLYASVENREIKIYDISNPASPVESGSIPTKTRSMVASGNQVYVAAGGDGFALYNSGGPGNPLQRGILTGIGLPRDVAVKGDILYVADGGVDDPGNYDATYGGLSILNAKNIDSIYTINNISMSSPANQVTLDGSRAYLTWGNCHLIKYHPVCPRGISDLNISDPSSVTPLQMFDLTDTLNQLPGYILPGPVAVQNQIAYVANTWRGLSILDFGQLGNPVLLGHFPHNSLTTPDVTGIAITGTYALVSSQTYQDTPRPSLQVVDISNPMTPTALTEYDMSDPHQITLAGSLAFLADGSAGLKVLNISHLPQVTVLGSLDTRGTTLDVAYDGHYAYVADGDSGLRMVDVSDLSHPVEVDAFEAGGRAANVTVSGDHIYLADEKGGLLVFSLVQPKVYMTLLLNR